MKNHVTFEGENGDIIQVTRTTTDFPAWLIILLALVIGLCGLSQPGPNSCDNPEYYSTHHRVC
jgi:hypothetical protein